MTEEDLYRRLAVNVRIARKAAGLTLKSSSERVEMHWRHWQKIEEGIEVGAVDVTLQTLVRMGEVLDIDPADLICEPPAEPAAKKK